MDPERAALRPSYQCVVSLLLAATLAAPHVALSQSRRFELADLAKLTRLNDPQISPDGRSIVVVVSRPNYDDDRHESELVLVDVVAGTQRVLTHERRRVSQPRWSPSDRQLAFLDLAGTGKDAQVQVFVMRPNGGDAQQVTSAPSGVRQFAWRPDGREIAFQTVDEPERKSGPERYNDAFEVGDNDYLAAEAARPTHIWLASVEGGETRRLTSGLWSTATSLVTSPLSWSSDGKAIAFTRIASPNSGDSDQGTVQIVDVATGQVHALTRRTAGEGALGFSPDGSRLAFTYPRDGDPANGAEIYAASASGGDGTRVTHALDRNVSGRWMPDGRSLLVSGNDGTRVALWLQPLDGPARRVELGDIISYSDFTVGSDGALALIGVTAGRPPELYYFASPTSPPKRLTDFHREVAALDLGRTDAIEWTGPGGFHEDGVLTFPPNVEPGKTYPLVLLIHGGPTGASTQEFNALSQLMAARGWVVFQPNYRGSDNLGNAYQHAIVNDAGDGPGRDVMAGLAVVKKRGFVDTTRIAVSGWSWGGFVTIWLTGHFHGFRAAVAGAAATDLLDMYALSDLNVIRRHSIVGSPWVGGREQRYREQSPITYASRIRTPTLILHDTKDARVTVTQSYKLYHALRDNGVAVKFVAYPVPGHFPGDPVRARDVYSRWLDWLDHYLGSAVSAK